MWPEETTGWTAPYFELPTVCYDCEEDTLTMAAGFNPNALHMCPNCCAEFTQEEGILRRVEKYTKRCIRKVEHGNKTEPQLLRIIDSAIYDGARLGSNATLEYRGYLAEEGPFFTIPLPETFRHP